ncbi:MAG: DNA mismatch repair protein MutS [Acidobacteria bacterium]|nr:DNA mismatch repair protein MutS [Acidobacteriota bacterium]
MPTEYQARLEARQATFQTADSEAARFGNFRLLIVAAALTTAWVQLWPAVAVSILAFIAIGIAIQKRQQAVDTLKRAIAYYEESIARTQGNWQGRGVTGESHRPPEHLYASDLDLFGQGSLFELLCRARTRMGESTLAHWLLNPAPPVVITARQQSIEELTPALDLREDLAVIAAKTKPLKVNSLESWGEAPATPLDHAPRPLYRAISLLGLFGALALAADILGANIPNLRLFYLPIAILCGITLFRFKAQIDRVLHAAEGASYEIALLAAVLARIEKETFQTSHLITLRARLDIAGDPPSRRIAKLRFWMDMADSRDHFLVKLFGFFILYDFHLAAALEDWRKQSGPAMRRWIEAVGEIEALSSLANYRYENPTLIFPTITTTSPTFKATRLTHPLMPAHQAVPNDIHLNPSAQVLVISGSNMSGKSTLMRTVGTNAVLALAGAPVSAATLEISTLTIGASISTHDSLQNNTSRFYAEILRLRDIMHQAKGPTPMLFLIDEVLSGTNSHDRRIGAAAILKGLVESNAIGLASTHDLALTQIAEDLKPRASNVHFEDQLVDGKMHFDYKMQPGIVTHSNAIALMRAVGLEV